MKNDIAKIRNDTPYCKDKLFFNSAGSSLPPSIINDTMIEYLREEEKVGGYKLDELRATSIQGFYEESAKMFNCRPENIAFTYNATDSFARAISSIPIKNGDVIITTDNDYISNFVAFISLKRTMGVEIIRIKNTDNGSLDLEDLEKLVHRHRPAFVSVTHVPTNSGLIQDVEGVGKICQKYEIWYIVDACQSVGQMPIDVNTIKCDFLCTTGRKFLRGPRGTGILYVSERVLDEELAPLFLDMRGAKWTGEEAFELFEGSRRFELWEFNYANVLGLKEAVRYGNELGWSNIYDYNKELVSHLRTKLDKVKGIRQYDLGPRLANIVTIRKEGINLKNMKRHLDINNVYYSVANGNNALIDFKKKNLDWAIRLSPHYFNTEAEVEKLCGILEEL